MTRIGRLLGGVAMLGGALAASPAWAQPTGTALPQSSKASPELKQALSLIARQQQQLEAQEARIRALEQRLAMDAQPSGATAAPSAANPPQTVQSASNAVPPPRAPNGAPQAPAGPVGEAPPDIDRPPEVAVLGEQGSVVTRRGQLTAELQLDYARADRNRALFRGIEVVESVLVGVFDINESRQDVLTASAGLRYGLLGNVEIGARLPFVYRNDKSVLAPIQGTTGDPDAATIDSSTSGRGIGDLELSARYQLSSARGGWPFLIGNLQVVVPTGTDPFDISRDTLGRATRAATGSGFWGVTPSLTAILPSDPAVLFGSIGYTRNFGHGVDTVIPPVRITYVKPGDAISVSMGIGVSLNQRTSFNLGYAHSWSFGTRTTQRLLMPTMDWGDPQVQTARDLQIGRLLFGVSYRATDRTTLNWSVEIGATEDATDLRTVLRIPFVLSRGR
ncbi:hypothetical protein M2337_001202 [Sphingobium sp. B2D3A]|uniref:transporter n=1 Tax=unclassified Sphingobium TaxID=2611147 RepID=UPI002225B69C|nr:MULTISPECIES: transporter [unclassified Sphingobium]MCW2336969.1 hypothetical protein [Sphingobium sp. B2D3A]